MATLLSATNSSFSRGSLLERVRELAHPTPLTRREVVAAAIGLVVLSVLVLAPHVGDAAFYTDDWPFAAIRYSSSGTSLFHAFRSSVGGRPALGVYLPIVFTVFGLHPAAHLAWVALITAGLGFEMFVVLRMLRVTWLLATGAAALLVVFPFADATKLWVSASPIQWSLVLYGAGVIVAIRAFADPSTGRMTLRPLMLHATSLGFYALSILTYESTIGLVACSVVVYAAKATRRAAAARWVADVILAAVLAKLVLARTPKTVHHGLGDELHHARLIAQQGAVLFGHVLFPWETTLSRRALAAGLLLIAIACCAALFASGRSRGGLVRMGQTFVIAVAILWVASGRLERHIVASSIGLVVCGVAALLLARDQSQRNRIARSLLLAAVGFITIAAGYVAYIPADDYYSPYGTEGLNRVNAAASIGYVLLTVSLLALAAAIVFRSQHVQLAVTGLLLVALFAGYTQKLVHDEFLWNQAGDAERETLSELSRTVPAPLRAETIYYWGGRTALTPQLPVFNSTWDLPNALALAWHEKGQAHAYPMLETTGFRCGARRMYPEQGLYGPSYGATYGDGIFVAPTLRRTVVESRAQCVSLVARLSTPSVVLQGLPATVSAATPVHVVARARLGRQPLDALELHFRLGSTAAGATCDAVTLPSGVATCWLTVPPRMRGAEALSVSFRGSAPLRAAREARQLLIRPPAD